jgi:hypothetical protein
MKTRTKAKPKTGKLTLTQRLANVQANLEACLDRDSARIEQVAKLEAQLAEEQQARRSAEETLELYKRDDANVREWAREERETICTAVASQLCVWGGAVPQSTRNAVALALGELALKRAENRNLRDANDMLTEQVASLEKKFVGIAAWARDYFAEGDPARAWVLSLLDPVESRGGIVAMSNGSSIAVAAEGKIA